MNNVGTAVAVCQAVEKGIPLVSRVVTVSGDGVKKPGNYLVPVGTLISDLIAYCGGFTGEIAKIIAGEMCIRDRSITIGEAIKEAAEAAEDKVEDTEVEAAEAEVTEEEATEEAEE